MSRVILSKILFLLPRLTPEELDHLRKQVSGRLKLTGSPIPSGLPQRPELDWLLEGFYHVLRARGLLAAKGRLPMGALGNLAPKYAEESEAVRELLLSRIKPQLNAVQCLKLGQVCGAAMADFVGGWAAPLGPKLLLRNVSRVPEAIEGAYPGYLRAGMLRLLIDAS